VLLRGAFLCVVVTHERLPSAGDMSEFLSIEGCGTRRQLACADGPLGLPPT
jgi:hypothetical protein